jgi:hypothetical protein
VKITFGFFEKTISMKMESHAAGAKFDCLLFGKDLTLQIYIFPFSGFISKKRRRQADLYFLLFILNYCPDMDDTLYPLSLGINLACRKNIIGKYRRSISIQYLKCYATISVCC